MHEILKGKKAVFLDVGNTLEYAASGDFMITLAFLKASGEKITTVPREVSNKALSDGYRHLLKYHGVKDEKLISEQFVVFYKILSDEMGLGLSDETIREIADDRLYNSDNFKLYPGVPEALDALSKQFRLGVISDTWTSLDDQLEKLGILKYFSFRTYSCDVGAFKPEKAIFDDALAKCGCEAGDVVFVDDNLKILKGAAALGITPVLMAAEASSDVETDFLKIHSLKELL